MNSSTKTAALSNNVVMKYQKVNPLDKLFLKKTIFQEFTNKKNVAITNKFASICVHKLILN